MINKQKIILPSDSDEQKIILSHACDLYTKSDFSGKTFFTKFLTPADAREIELRFPSGDVAIGFWGGYDGAERVVAHFGEVTHSSQYPLSVVNVRQRGGKELSHRDYLGTVLSLGIGRELLGDIIVNEDGAIIFCLSEIADYIKDNLSKVGGAGVSCTVSPSSEFSGIERRYQKLSATVSSLRLDCVVSAACGKSRSASAALVERSFVTVNYKTAASVSAAVKDGDVISVRGEGKFMIKTDEKLTRKGRIHIDIYKYV